MGVCVCLFAATVVALTLVVYRLPASHGIVRHVASVLPYPAATVNGEPIAFQTLYEEETVWKRVTRSGAEPASLERILDVLVSQRIVTQLAEVRGVVPDIQRVEETMRGIRNQSGSEETFTQDIAETFGWNMEKFRERVVLPLVLASELQRDISGDVDIQAHVRGKIEAAARRLEEGERFADVARTTGEDASAADGGDRGYVPFTSLPNPLAEAIPSLSFSVPSDVIELDDGFVIVQITDQLTQGNETLYRLHVIFVAKKILDDVVQDMRAQADIRVFARF